MKRPSLRNPRRLLVMLLLLLTGGALVNVAVAGSCWFWGSRPSSSLDAPPKWEFRASTRQDIRAWERWATPEWPAPPKQTGHQTSFGLRFHLMVTIVNDFDPTDLGAERWAERAKKRSMFWIDSVQSGWPCLTIAITQATESSGFPPTLGVRGDATYIGRLVIPTRLIWPGFAINTIFYAAILWGVFAAPLALRRRRRVKRGLCPACAYPIGDSPVCTECGRAVVKR